MSRCEKPGFGPTCGGQSVSPGPGGGHIIQNETGTDMPQEPKLQFVGFDVTDDPDGTRTIVAKSDRPQKPQNLSPYDGETDVYQFATFVGTNYVQPEGIPMGAMRLQIATDSNFTNLVVDRTENQSSVSIMLDGTELAANETQYFWRIQYATAEGIWSAWSDPTTFTTEMAFSPNVILTPMMLSPTEDGTASAENALLLGSSFAQIGEPTIHQASSWKVNTRRDAKGTDLWGETDSTVDLNSAMVDVDLTSVPADQKVYAGVQYNGANGTKSKWSPFVGFYRRPYYDDPLLGIELVKTSAASSVIRYIDINGDYVTLRGSYFNTHPIYTQISQLVQDGYGNHFALVPPVYCKTTRNGDVFRFWISPNPEVGFKLHPAFRLSPSGFLRARYFSGLAANSLPNSTFAPTTVAAWLNAIAPLNTSGTLYHPETVYESALIRLLMLIEARTISLGDVFGNAGSNNCPSGSSDNTTKSTWPVWRGLYNEYGFSSYGRLAMGVQYINPARSTAMAMNIGLSTPESPLSTPIQVLSWAFDGSTLANGIYGTQDMYSGYNDYIGDDLALLFIAKGGVTSETANKPGPFGGFFSSSTSQLGSAHSIYQNWNTGGGAQICAVAINLYMKLSKWIA